MKKNPRRLQSFCLAVGLALAAANGRAQTVNTGSLTNSFPNGGVETPVTGGGTSVASYIYWYSIYQDYLGAGYNLPMTNAPTFDAGGGGADSGSLNMYIPWGQTRGNADQSLVIGSFGNQGVFDGSIVTPVNIITQMSCDIYVAAPVTSTNSAGNFGEVHFNLWIQIGNNIPNDSSASSVTIPASAANHWAHLTFSDPTFFAHYINNVADNAAGMGLYLNTYGGPYPSNDVQYYVDNMAITTSSAPPPPPPAPSMTAPVNFGAAGLNCIFVSGSGQYNREEVGAGDTGFGPLDASDPTKPVTYTWTYQSLPGAAHNSYQAHFFICSDDNGSAAANSSADYGSSNVIFLTVQRNADGSGTCNFRVKTNQPAGNGQLFTAALNPKANLNDPNPVGTWSLSFLNETNVTITGPSGTSTNFNLDPAIMAWFSESVSPQVIQLGGQANNPADEGQDVVYSSFSLSNAPAAFSDDFVADAVGNNGGTGGLMSPWTATGDPGAVQLFQAGDTNLLVTWSVTTHYDLQGSTTLAPANWVYLTGANASANITKIRYVSNSAAFVTPDTFSGNNGGTAWSNQVYFQMKLDN